MFMLLSQVQWSCCLVKCNELLLSRVQRMKLLLLPSAIGAAKRNGAAALPSSIVLQPRQARAPIQRQYC
jgi:hypothetical protein